MFHKIMSGRYWRLKSATDPHHKRVDTLCSDLSMFGSESSYKNYLQATLASRLLLESMLEASHIEALLPQWSERRIEPDLTNDISDVSECSPPETLKFKRATEPVDLPTIIGTLYALEASAIRVPERMTLVSKMGFTKDFGARHINRQILNLRSWQQTLNLIEITPFDDDDEERCTFAAIAAFGAFEYNYQKVFNDVAPQRN
ncbi:biliverdin-producing heme oxygenase [Brucella pseudogrignonensis]|uniref:biliverdin-producing heme oxygenase n=1 Tax=Brucella TaxID=234 RepID=UPI0028B710DA|nr:biliverdin-producing heme oxygenase [Brucella pseudogrignonensis]MDT6941178.1 biliverdin-producing heme oxygenase [Brucella pseudogrignonensis]